ncbi:dermonecrotic toxin domain-containing protein [Pseudomonas grimontii]|uniref:dermonecrotic toxin domain-containing protein n=1 Tax=Pseudomonas grimontii TaxID=129847 RepID=UPI0028E40DE7|nr:DUF6543 domain-containing protein [Pseudomonas grimontii]
MATQPETTVLPYQILKNALPQWLGNAAADKRTALANHAPVFADWYKNTSEAQHNQLKYLNSQAWTAQNQVDSAMAELKSPEEFGAERLQQALAERYGVDANVRTTYLQLYIPLTVAGFTVKPGAARTWSVSLLDAALHNFEPSEAQAGAYEASSGFTTQPTAAGHFAPLPAIQAKISIPQFATLCRQLDIGGQYQRYLNEYLGRDNPVARASLRYKVIDSQLTALKLALYMARIKNDLPQTGYDAVYNLITDVSANGCQPMQCHELVVMSTRLTGIVVFCENLATSRVVLPVIVYIPDDPQHPVKQYASSQAFVSALVEKLRDPEYQRFFSRFVDHQDLGAFFAGLNQRLTRVTWHPHTPGDPLPSWRETAVEKPNLQFRPLKISGELFDHLHQMKLSKLINDARSRAVSTASVDQKARWERWAVIQKIGSTLLQIVALIAMPFIPPLGALMLGYTAYQMLDDAFEGIIDWTEGLPRQALGHAMSFLEQLVQLGMFAVGAPIAEGLLRAALPAELLQFIDRLKPVTRPSGKARLWQPDTAAYRHDLTLPADAKPNKLGLHRHRGQSVLRLGDDPYVLHTDSASGRHALRHPNRTDAYRPQVLTNGQGAWVTELERPLSWDSTTLMRRLGYTTDGISDARLQQARRISDTHDNALRKMHVTQQTPPPLLADTLKRIKIDQHLQDFILQMGSDDPALYQQADPQLQLQLLTNYGLWPETKTLRFLDAKGNTAWELKRPDDAGVVQIHEAQLKNGNLLSALIESLDEPERKTLLKEPFGTPPASSQTRANVLRKQLARIAEDKRFSLFDAHYRGLERARDARVQKLIDAAPNPGLPTSVAEEILADASGEELQAIDQAKVPARLVELAEWAQHEVRTTRAYEGLYLDTVESPDTHQLALNSLENLPGWLGNVRLEVRQYRIDGALLDAIGAEDAAIKRTIIATAQGDYVPQDHSSTLFGRTDFYTAILQAIPDASRDSLNIHIGQGPRLQQAIAEHAMDRRALRRLLDANPSFKPTYDPSVMRLRGGMEGYRAADDPQPGPSGEPSLQQRAHDLLPSLSAEQIRDLVQTLERRPGGAQATLVSLKNEYMKMDMDLAVWEANPPRFHSETEAPLSRQAYEYAARNRAHWAREIRRAWRQETEVDNHFEPPTSNGQMLRLLTPISGELPRLSARFEHISLLELTGDYLPLNVNAFVQQFPRLRQLIIRKVALQEFPGAVASMPHFNELILSDCNLALTTEDQMTLSRMTRLITLDLYNNPLQQAPNVEHMQNLQYLDLSNTGIRELPRGLLSRTHLDLVLLPNNQIRELPDELFNLPASASDTFDLSGNPISPLSLARVKTYFQNTGKYWDIDADPADAEQVRRLYPSLNTDEVNRFIFALPGDLQAGKVALNRLETDYQGMRATLLAWANDVHVSAAERVARDLLRKDMEAGWRQELPLAEHENGTPASYELTLSRPISGALPTLPTPFKHVSSLTLRGGGGPLQPAAFLQAFPALKRLAIERFTLTEFPLDIAKLQQLNRLRLNHNALRLSPSSANTLAGMSRLEHLDLSENPLGFAPDTSRLAQLSHLSLRNTGLTEIPSDLLSTTAPERQVDLSHNAIQEIPDAAFALPARRIAGVDLRANPLSRQALRQIKNHYPSVQQHWMASPPPAELQRLKALYPNLADAEIGHVYFQLPGDLDAAASEIIQLGIEYEQLRADLQEWALNIPLRDPLLDVVLDAGTRAEEQLRRMQFKTLLEHCWRREIEVDESGTPPYHTYKLVFHAQLLGDMPRLRARFDHVTLIELIGEGSNLNADGLLRRFPNLRHLIIERYTLADIPEPIFSMNALRELGLPENRIRLTPRSAGQLAQMSNLVYLDLSDNPLGITPDVRNLARMQTLYLHNCGLTEVPAGVFGMTQLQVLDLSDNSIEHLHTDLLEMPRPLFDDSDLSGNPLSAQSLELLRRYFRQTGNELGVEAAMEDAQGNPLTPPGTPPPMEE